MSVLLMALVLAVDWQSQLPAIRALLKAQFPQEGVEEHYPVSLFHIGGSEALVYLGTGGASTSELTLVRMEDGKPVVALFKDRQAKVGPMIFLEGASVMHSDGTELLPADHAVFHFFFNYAENGRIGECSGEAYRWNPRSKLFEYDRRLSQKLARDACRKVPLRNQ